MGFQFKVITQMDEQLNAITLGCVLFSGLSKIKIEIIVIKAVMGKYKYRYGKS